MYNIGIKGIYLITRKSMLDDAEPIYYIGQAKDIFKRFQEHCENICNTGIDAAIKKYGITSFSFEILEIISKQNDRDRREKEFIKEYINKYGEYMLYNRQTGGKRGQTPININRQKMDKDIRNNIRKIFNQDISYSIYLIAEYFNLNWEIIVSIRKHVLKQKGLKYDQDKKQVILIETGEPPAIWNGGILTEKQVTLYKANKDKGLEELANMMNASISDLKKFRDEYDGRENDYESAEKQCNLNFLNGEDTRK